MKPNSSLLSQTRRRGKHNGQGLLKLFDEKFPLKKKVWYFLITSTLVCVCVHAFFKFF